MKHFKLFFLSAILLVYSMAYSTNYYVSTEGNDNNNGTNPSTPWRELSYALTQINVGDIIYVAEGIYKPTTDLSRDISFEIPCCVKVYGGYSKDFLYRDMVLHETVLSGNIGDLNIDTDNSFHVVVLLENNTSIPSILDGFTITKGYANIHGDPNFSKAGGIIAKKNCVVSNCIITNNYAGDSGGAYLEVGSKMSNCIVMNNEASSCGGVTISGATIENSFIINNIAFVESPSPGGVIGGANISGFWDGVNYQRSLMINCLIANNQANVRISALNVYQSTVINSTIVNNNFTDYFGFQGMAVALGENSSLYNSIVWGNTNEDSFDFSDQIHSNNDFAEILNCAVLNGTKGISGNYNGNNIIALVEENDGCNPLLNYPRFFEPTSFTGCADGQAEELELKNSNWGITATSACANEGNNIYVQNIPTDIIGNPRIFDDDEDKVDIGAYESFGRLYVKPKATGNGSGFNWENSMDNLQTALSAKGIPEVWVAKGTYYPDRDKNGIFSPSDPRTKCFSIPENKKVFGGFYGTENSIDQRILDDLDNNGITEEWEFKNEVILSGDIGYKDEPADNCYTVVNFIDPVEECAEINNSELNGFTVTKGNANADSQNFVEDQSGGGINAPNGCNVSSCYIVDNNASIAGGGIYEKMGSVTNTLISDNKATYGGGINCFDSDLLNCKIVSNTADMSLNSISQNSLYATEASGDGGGIYISQGSVQNCYLWNNSAFCGGGIYINVVIQESIIENCIIVNNYVRNEMNHGIFPVISGLGAGIFCNTSNYAGNVYDYINIINNTVCNNKAETLFDVTYTADGGGIYIYRAVGDMKNRVNIYNNIIWGNVIYEEHIIQENQISYFDATENPDIDNNGIENAPSYIDPPGDEANINLDASNNSTNGPHFENPTTTAGNNPVNPILEEAEWNLTSSSVCIDEASANYAPDDDIIGTFRPQGNADDQGAYEFVGTKSSPVLELFNVNPTSHEMWTDGKNIYVNSPEDAFIEIYSLSGQKIMELNVNKGLNLIKTTLSGIFIVKLRNDSTIKTEKLFF